MASCASLIVLSFGSRNLLVASEALIEETKEASEAAKDEVAQLQVDIKDLDKAPTVSLIQACGWRKWSDAAWLGSATLLGGRCQLPRRGTGAVAVFNAP